MSNKLRFNLFDRVATADPKAAVFALGVTIQRPDDARGDSVNQLMLGGRFDALTEALEARRAKSVAAAESAENADIAVSQAAQDVPVTQPVAA